MKTTLDRNLVTGNHLIDEQHRELIAKIEKLVNCCKEGGGKIEAVKMLDYLADYTDFHFREEEVLQKEYGYPELAAHQEQHLKLRQAVGELYEMLQEEGPSDAFVEAVNRNVKEWLFGHIKTFDRAVASHISGYQEEIAV